MFSTIGHHLEIQVKSTGTCYARSPRGGRHPRYYLSLVVYLMKKFRFNAVVFAKPPDRKKVKSWSFFCQSESFGWLWLLSCLDSFLESQLNYNFAQRLDHSQITLINLFTLFFRLYYRALIILRTKSSVKRRYQYHN